MALDKANPNTKHKIMQCHLGAIKNIAYQTLPNNPLVLFGTLVLFGKFGTFVRKITVYPFFALREPTRYAPLIFLSNQDISDTSFEIMAILSKICRSFYETNIEKISTNFKHNNMNT